jgi:ketose-bisphosphate aldolase
MQRVSSKEMIATAYQQKRAVAAMNVSNMETVAAVLKAADHLNQPVLLQVSPLQKEVHGFSYERMMKVIQAVADEYARGAYAVHLDHAQRLDDCKQALQAGFDSAMLDGAALPFEENIASVFAVRNIFDGALEGELGVVGGGEANSCQISMSYTDPSLAAEFVQRTGVDWLAVAIGNAHGIYHGKPQLNFEILQQLQETLSVPLVLHGASGIPHDDLKRAIRLGVSKINFFTELDLAFQKGLKKEMDKNTYMMFLSRSAQDAMQKKAEELLTVCANV